VLVVCGPLSLAEGEPLRIHWMTILSPEFDFFRLGRLARIFGAGLSDSDDGLRGRFTLLTGAFGGALTSGSGVTASGSTSVCFFFLEPAGLPGFLGYSLYDFLYDDLVVNFVHIIFGPVLY